MRYTTAIVFGVVVITLMVAVASFLLVRQWRRYRKHLEVVARVEARENALWEKAMREEKLHTVVSVRQVARVGTWSEELGQQTVGKVSHGAEDYTKELDDLWVKAEERAFQLNFGLIP